MAYNGVIMAFTKYSKIGSPLTFDRENNIFANIVEDGVFSGMQVYDGSSGFDISIAGGFFAKNGIIWKEGATLTDILTVPTPITDEHHIIWIDVSTDTPSYEIKSGTYASPAALSPSELLNGLVIAHIWVSSTATGIVDCNIANLDRISTKEKPKFFVTGETLRLSEPVAGTVRMKTLNLRALRLGEYDGRNFCTFQIQNVNNFDITSVTQRYVIIFARSAKRWTDETEVVPVFYIQTEDARSVTESLLPIQGYGLNYGAATDKEAYPYRPNFQDIVVLAILDRTRNLCIYPGYGICPDGFGINNGSFENIVSTIISTEYGTTESGATIDIDEVITNLSTISTAGLQDVYEGMGSGIADATRIIEVEKPVEIHTAKMISEGSLVDAWAPALRLGTDHDGDNGLSGLMRALDIPSEYTNKKDRGILIRRPITINGKNCINTSISLIDGTTRVEVNTLNLITPTDLIVEYGQLNAVDMGKKLYLQILNCDPYTLGENIGAIFRLGVDAVNNVFYLISADDDSTIVLPSDLPIFVYPEAVNATLWDGRTEISHFETSINKLTVADKIQGVEGKILTNELILEGLTRSEVSDSSALESRVAPIRIGRKGYRQEVYDNGSSVSGARRLFSDGAHLIDVLVVNAAPIVVRLRKIDGGSILGSFSTDTSASSINVGYASIYTTSSGVIVCVPCGINVEFWFYNFATEGFTKEYSYAYGDGIVHEGRTSLLISDTAAWVGGDYNTIGTQHNAALYEMGTGIIDRYRFGKNNNCELYGKAFETDGYHMVVTALNGVSAAASAVQCVKLDEDGSVGATTMIVGSWINDITAPLSSCITDKFIIVYGTGAASMGFIERYPIYTGLFGSSTDATPLDSLELDADGAGNLTLSGELFGKSEGFVLVAEDNDIASGTETTCFVMEFDDESQNINTKTCIEEARSSVNFKAGVYAFDGIDAYVLSTVDNKCYKYCLSSTGKMVEAPSSGFISRRAFRVIE